MDTKNIKYSIELTTIGLLVVPSILYAYKIYRSYDYFSNRKIKTPDVHMFTGNLKELKQYDDESRSINEWTKKLGKTYGYYEGHTPVLVTSDSEIIEEVFIKQHNNFSARKRNPLEGPDNRPENHLMRATKLRWKRMRKIMSAAFTPSKLRDMCRFGMNKCIDRFINIQMNNTNKEIITLIYLKRLTLDSIWSCAYGFDLDVQNDTDNEYFLAGENVFTNAKKFNIFNYLSILFPELNFFLVPLSDCVSKLKSFDYSKNTPKIWMMKKFKFLLDERIKKKNDNVKDFLQLLVDALEDDVSVVTQNDQNLNDSNIILNKKLTYNEAIANLKMLMLAAYESTSYALNYCLYELSRNPEEQQKLFNEVASFQSADPTFKNVDLNEFYHLENFCKEILRFYPISKVVRRCVKETVVKGISMTPDLIVRIDVLAVHYDPEIYGPNAEFFDSTRHEIKRDSSSFLAFGIGPRECLGKSFALKQIKLTLINILSRFEIVSSENTPKKLEFFEGILRSSKTSIPFMFKLR